MPARCIPGSRVFSGSEVRRATAAFDGGSAISDAGPGRWDRRTGRLVRSAALRGASRTVVVGRSGGAWRRRRAGRRTVRSTRRRHGLPGATESDATRARCSGLPTDSGFRLPRRRRAFKARQPQTDLRAGLGVTGLTSAAADAAKVPVRSLGHRKTQAVRHIPGETQGGDRIRTRAGNRCKAPCHTVSYRIHAAHNNPNYRTEISSMSKGIKKPIKTIMCRSRTVPGRRTGPMAYPHEIIRRRVRWNNFAKSA